MCRSSALAISIAAVVGAAPGSWAAEDGRSPRLYITLGPDFDLEDGSTGIDFGIELGGSRKLGPEIELIDGRLLVGAKYEALGTVDKMRGVYGGPCVIYYRGHWGGGLTLGTHLSRRVILQGSYYVTPDWDGLVTISLGHGFDWSPF
jgi:hypothetical protein